MNRKLLLISCVLVPTLLQSWDASAQYGSQPEYAMGTRAQALGQTASASFSDALATSLNPAIVIAAHSPVASLFYTKLLGDAVNASFGVVVPTKQHGAFGLSYYHFRVRYLARYDDGSSVGEDSFDQQHFLLTYSNKLTSRLAYGFNAKLVRQSLEAIDPEPDKMGVDLGLQYAFGFTNPILKDLTLGFSIDNLVKSTLAFTRARNSLPQEWRLIAEKRVSWMESSATVVANLVSREVNSYGDEDAFVFARKLSRPRLHLGMEYSYRDYSVRMGYMPHSVSGGLGLRYKPLILGYSYIQSDDRFYSHHGFSLTCEF